MKIKIVLFSTQKNLFLLLKCYSMAKGTFLNTFEECCKVKDVEQKGFHCLFLPRTLSRPFVSFLSGFFGVNQYGILVSDS